MKKITLGIILLLSITILSGCQKKPEQKKEEIINPFSPSSMVDTYQGSKEKINDSVQKENAKLNDNLKEGGISE